MKVVGYESRARERPSQPDSREHTIGAEKRRIDAGIFRHRISLGLARSAGSSLIDMTAHVELDNVAALFQALTSLQFSPSRVM